MLPLWLNSKESACNAGQPDMISGLGRSTGGGHGNHSTVLVWRSPMDRGAWWATVQGITKSLTRLSSKQQYVAEIPKCTISDFSTLTSPSS